MDLKHGHDDDHDHDHDDRHRCIGVTVKTPAGFASAFATSGNRLAGCLSDRAVSFFVDANQLEHGDFKLALIRDCDPIPLEPTEALKTYGIVEGDTLHLVSCRPHVDGGPR